MKEMYRVKGIDEYTQRMESVNLSGGQTNALEFCNLMLGMPTLDKMLDGFIKNKTASV